MTPEERELALERAGVTTAVIARTAGVTWQHAHYVRRGERRSPRVEAAIAAALGLDVSEVFPPRETAAA